MGIHDTRRVREEKQVYLLTPSNTIFKIHKDEKQFKIHKDEKQ